MLLAWLLLTRAVAAEWVEISQQHYRKPVRLTPQEPTRTLHQNPQRDPISLQNPKKPYQDLIDYELDKPIRDEFVTKDRTRNPTMSPYVDPVKPVNPFLQDVSQSPISSPYEDYKLPTRDIHLHEKQESTTKETYTNHSITEHKWNLNKHGIYNGHGDGNKQTKVPSYDNWSETYGSNNDDDKIGEIMHKVDVSNVRVKEETVPGKIERVSNIGTVKRVELSNTPVKSPAINKISEKNTNRRNNNPIAAQNYDNLSDELNVETNIFNSNEYSFPRKPGNLKPYQSSEEVIAEVDNRRKNPFDDRKVPIPSVEKHTFTNKENVRFPTPDQNSTPENIESAEQEGGSKISSINSPAKSQHNSVANKDTFSGFIAENDKTTESIKVEEKNHIESDKNRNKNRGTVQKVHKVEKDSTENGEDTSSSSGEVKVNTMENILKFMKVVAETITKNTRRGANGKITYLNELKHSLLDNIKSRIDATFPDDEPAGSRRHSRSASSRGHVEFPSSESALMTISFLTFAVFLIKLVLQVIQTYKHKTMVMAPLVVATAGRKIASKLRVNNNNVDKIK